MRKQKIVLILMLLVFNGNLFAQWMKFPPVTDRYLQDIAFKDAETGFAVGSVLGYQNNVILKTTNNGISWSNFNSGAVNIRSIYFIDQNTGWMVGDNWLGSLPTGRMLKTTDGGNNWNIAGISYVWVFYNKIFFTDENTGWAVGTSGIFISTTNGGNNWNTKNIGSEDNFDFYFSNILTGYILTGNRLIHSINGFSSWDTVQTQETAKGMYFLNNQTGWLVGNNINKTTNGGINWQIQLYSTGLQKIKFINENTGYTVGLRGLIYRTSNSGVNWIQQNIDSTYELFAIDLKNYHTIYAAGSDGTILKSSNGGSTFISQNSSVTDGNFYLSQNYPNPFNPSTKINYELRNSNYVSLKVFDLLGKEVALLVNEKQNAGSYAVDFNSTGFNLPSGIYFYTLNAGEFKETRKMVLVK